MAGYPLAVRRTIRDIQKGDPMPTTAPIDEYERLVWPQ